MEPTKIFPQLSMSIPLHPTVFPPKPELKTPPGIVAVATIAAVAKFLF